MKNYITILEDKGSGKFTINNPDSLGLENDVYDEIKLIDVNENVFLLINKGGKCGLFDAVEKSWIYKPEYDRIRFIDIQETPQGDIGKSYMCELEINGFSGLFLFTKCGNSIVAKESLITPDKYTEIHPTLFSEKRVYFTNESGANEILNQILFVELKKGSMMGCEVIKNTLHTNKAKKTMMQRNQKLMNIECKYSLVRPSQFDGDDGYIKGSESFEPDDIYIYEIAKNHVGADNNIHYPIQKKICLNQNIIMETLEKKLLLFATDEGYGVLHGDEEIIPPYYSPQMLCKEEKKDGEYKTKFILMDGNCNLHEITSILGDWKRNCEEKFIEGSEYTD